MKRLHLPKMFTMSAVYIPQTMGDAVEASRYLRGFKHRIEGNEEHKTYDADLNIGIYIPNIDDHTRALNQIVRGGDQQ